MDVTGGDAADGLHERRHREAADADGVRAARLERITATRLATCSTTARLWLMNT
jgi:hypothetical protein